jgi:hypothetical protein
MSMGDMVEFGGRSNPTAALMGERTEFMRSQSRRRRNDASHCTTNVGYGDSSSVLYTFFTALERVDEMRIGRQLGVVWLLSAAALAGWATAAGSIDRVDRREACREEAHRSLNARKNAGREIYAILVERRQAYVRDCMDDTGGTSTTGSVSTRSRRGIPSTGQSEPPHPVPIPPPRPARSPR